ncbi:MAG: hypothetical protein U1E61_09795 [Bradyrhizobium sp.]
MNEQFFHDRAKTVRELAERADPHTKRRLLELASRYEKKPRPPTPLPVQPKPLNNAVGLVEEILSIPSGDLSALVDRDENRVGGPAAPILTTRLLSEVIRGRGEK